MTCSTLQNLHEIVTQLHSKYEKDEYMIGKLVTQLTQLPNTLNEIQVARCEKAQRKQSLIIASDEFIESFLNEAPQYYYNQNVDLFFIYNPSWKQSYQIINEDDILHPILTQISIYRELLPWKYKIKNQILRHIKDKSLLDSIPESSTIQRVLNMLTPLLFRTRDCAKYFLTIIGDVILKKNVTTVNEKEPIYILNQKCRSFVKELSIICNTLFGTPFLSAFKFKFYEYPFEDCRLLDVNEVSIDIHSEPFKKHIIDILCVSAHYSTRYINAENFLNMQCKDTTTQQRVLYLKPYSQETLVSKFIQTCTETSPQSNVRITWKNMLYLWKVFIEDERIPNVLFVNLFKQLLIQRLPSYSETTDSFLQLTSKHLPLVTRFNEFWTQTITISSNPEDELEIDEFTTLFKKHQHTLFQNQSPILNSHNQTESTFLGLIRHFYPDVVIENDKHLIQINCNLWDKRGEVVNIIENSNSNTSSYKAYEMYCQKQRTLGNLIVNKKYFEKIYKDIV